MASHVCSLQAHTYNINLGTDTRHCHQRHTLMPMSLPIHVPLHRGHRSTMKVNKLLLTIIILSYYLAIQYRHIHKTLGSKLQLLFYGQRYCRQSGRTSHAGATACVHRLPVPRTETWPDLRANRSASCQKPDVGERTKRSQVLTFTSHYYWYSTSITHCVA